MQHDEEITSDEFDAACVVVTDGEQDGQQMALRSALEELMISGGALLSCIPGRLAM